MKDFPHTYITNANADKEGTIVVSTEFHEMNISAPIEFDGDNDHWSPEDLFSAGISSCYILTLKSLSKHKHIEWKCVDVLVTCYLKKGDKGVAFYEASLEVKLKVEKGEESSIYEKLLRDSERYCLFSNSLITKINFSAELIFE